MNNNPDQPELGNLIPPNLENNENIPNNEQQSNESFFQRISSKDVLHITSDFFPSIILIGFIINALANTEKFCDSGFNSILRALMFIYSAFVMKSLLQTVLICLNTQNSDFSKVSLNTLDFILNMCYYIAVTIGYFIYRGRPDECFMSNTFATILLFCLVLIGIINISRQILNIFMIILCFPIMVYYFLKNPQSFYTNFGIDPEIVRNLPTIKADASQTSFCAICTEDIKEGDEILMLRCPGKHYYHANCIKNWLIRKVNCPVCRHENVL